MQLKEILLGIPVVVFIFWVFTAPLPQERIARGCEPINWVGNLATSATALATEAHTPTSARWSDKMNYSCQYLIWRLFYQTAYNKAVKEGQIAPTAPTDEQVIEESRKESLTPPQPGSAVAPVTNPEPKKAAE